MTARRWVLTVNNPTEEEIDQLLNLSDGDLLRYACLGIETGESGTLHVQGYVQLKKPVRYRQVQTLISPDRPSQVHVEICRGSHDQARNYIANDDKEGSFGWWEVGNATSQGTRADLMEVKSMIDNGKTQFEVANEYFGTWVHSHRALSAYQNLVKQNTIPRWRQLHVTVLYGPTGTGKTRRAADHPSFFMLNQGNGVWFDGYSGQERLILDDFTGWMPLAQLLKVLDGYPLRLDVKGGTTWAAWTEVILTSNLHPKDWYSPEVTLKHPGALERRLNEIIEIT